ncbi:MAG TPA: hypothetical protein VHP63_01645 [candidate division Zixibacteria bacterium]|nr:hypothetical protein [candidate division Zixibacteria bacterium]
MSKAQKIILTTGALLAAVTFLYPCWQRTEVHYFSEHIQLTPAGMEWDYLFAPPQPDTVWEPYNSGRDRYVSATYHHTINWQIQIAQIVVILILCTIGYLLFKPKSIEDLIG